jgi:hypothetical protein
VIGNPYSVAVDALGNLYIAQTNGFEFQAIRKVNAAGTITTIAGNGTPGFSGDGGPATLGQINRPFAVTLDSGGVYYLQFPDENVFGYYNYPSSSILFHYDMGFEAFIPGSAADIYLYDFTSVHWWYTSSTLFPYLYGFTLNSWIYYFPNTTSPGHYTTNPRYFSNLTTGKIFTM